MLWRDTTSHPGGGGGGGVLALIAHRSAVIGKVVVDLEQRLIIRLLIQCVVF